MVLHAETKLSAQHLAQCFLSIPAEREEDARLDCLIIEPGRILDNLNVSGQQHCHPLHHPGCGGPKKNNPSDALLDS